MAGLHGKFMWYTLMTSDTKAARGFYQGVIGWTSQEIGREGQPDAEPYTVFQAAGAGVAGTLTLDAEEARRHGIPPHWIGYVYVDNVDAAASAIAGAGGAIHHGAEDIPGIGRFAAVADPQGAAFIVFKPTPPEQPRPEAAPDAVGHVGWHELHAADWQAVFPFYEAQFGWSKTAGHDMGPMGVYQLFATGGAGDVGGVFNKPPQEASPYWLYYFNVEDIKAAIGRATQAGGTLLNGPHQVPGGQWIAQFKDPQGAAFALVAPK
jgi:predicted enzyme related to lactoylglutathione lyase